MRFSIRWLLAAATYVAVVCASFRNVNEVWGQSLSAVVLATLALAAMGWFASRTGRRAFCGCFFVVSVLLQFLLFSSNVEGASESQHAVLRGNSEFVQSQLHRMVRRYVAREARIRSYLEERCPAGFEFDSVLGVVEHGALFHVAFRLRSIVDADRFVKRYADIPRSLVPDDEWAAQIERLAKFHLILLVSFLGGLLGLWFSKREERQSAARNGDE